MSPIAIRRLGTRKFGSRIRFSKFESASALNRNVMRSIDKGESITRRGNIDLNLRDAIAWAFAELVYGIENHTNKSRKPGRPACASPPGLVLKTFRHFNYSVTASISATKRPASLVRNAEITSNTASLKPPTFRISLRSGACVIAFGCRSMQINFGPKMSPPWSRTWFCTNCCHSVTTPVEPPVP